MAKVKANQIDKQGVADLAGVPVNTVKVWRQRHPDFPEPVRFIGRSPLFDEDEVKAWLAIERKPGHRREAASK